MKTVGTQAIALLSGAIFGFGLALSGMTRPEKVQGFLNFFRGWDPALMFVMGGAVAVHAVLYRVITRRASPVFAARFMIPTRKDLDARLLLGSAIFGVGWGLGGFCPGPGITSLVTGLAPAATFVAAMVAGMYVTARLETTAAPKVDLAPATERSRA